MTRFDLRLAWWLTRGQAGRVWLLIACIAIGVAARVCVGSFTGTFARSLAREARPLLGADLEIVSNQPLTAAQQADLAAALPAGAHTIHQLGFVTMGAVPRTGQARTVELRAVSPGYPLYGEVSVAADDATPSRADLLRLFASPPAAYVQRELLIQLGAHVGDLLRLGRGEFIIAGVLLAEPGLGANPFALGPRVLIDYAKVAETGLVASGARVRHSTLVASADPLAAETMATRLRAQWKLSVDAPSGFAGRAESESGVIIRSARQAQASVARFFDRLGDYLRLVSLLALLLGGVGVASMVRGFMHAQLDAVATLAVLGASSGRVARVFLFQALGIGALGGAVGALVGTAVQNLLLVLLRGNLPIAGGLGVDLPAVGWGMALGVVTTGVFAALPLLEMRGLRPAAVWHGDALAAHARAPVAILTLAAFVLFAALAALEAHSLVVGPLFIAALGVGAVVTWTLGRMALGLLARWRPGGFGVRHGLANLGRAAFRPASAVVSLGLAAQLFGTLAVYQASLQHELDPAARSDLPSLFAIDIQLDQCTDFRALLAREFAVPEPLMSPLVRGRYRGKDGPAGQGSGDGNATASDAALTREGENRDYFRNREQNLSWRTALGPDETIIAGRWMQDDGEHVEASLEQRFAGSIGATLGDVLVFDVQGVRVAATVTSLRSVHWTSLRPNFFIYLTPRALVDAPQTWVAAVPHLDPAARARVQARLAERFPNVMVFDVAEAGTRVNTVIERIATAVRFMGLFALGAGLVVLAGIALSSGRERRADAALLKVLGARNRTLALSLACEFGALGLVAGGLGLAQALGVGWLLVERVLDLRLSVPWLSLAALLGAMATLSAVAGLSACRTVFSARPLAVLREG